MDNKAWRNVSLVLAAVCMMLIGFGAALLYTGKPNPSSSSGPTSPAVTSPTPTPSPTGSVMPTASPTATIPKASASATGSVKPTASPKPTPSAPMASVTFSNMQLDSKSDPEGKARTFTFTSDGPGPITATVVKSTAKATTRLCFSVDGSKEQCWQNSKPALNGTANSVHSAWTVTLIGADGYKPTVDVTFTWPTNSADIKLSHGRLQGLGADSPLNGATATFKARADGKITLAASWPPLIVDAVVTCADVTQSPAINGGEVHYAGTGSTTPPASFDATAAHIYKIELRDLSADGYRPDLTFDLSFP